MLGAMKNFEQAEPPNDRKGGLWPWGWLKRARLLK